MTVPERWDLPVFRLRQQRGQLAQPFRLEAEERVRAELDRDRTLGVVAQREAGDSERRRLLLDPPRVRYHCRGFRFEREKLPVRQRLCQEDACRAVEILSSPRMHRKDHRKRLGDVIERGHRPFEQVMIVDEPRAMERDEDIPPWLETELTPGLELERRTLARS